MHRLPGRCRRTQHDKSHKSTPCQLEEVEVDDVVVHGDGALEEALLHTMAVSGDDASNREVAHRRMTGDEGSDA